MRQSIRIALAMVLTAALAAPAMGETGEMNELMEYASTAGPKPLPGEAESLAPHSPNPYLSILPAGVKPDWLYWNARSRDAAAGRRALDPGLQGAIPTVRYVEAEVGEGLNDSIADGEHIAIFGSADGERPRALIEGAGAQTLPTTIGPFPEDDGSIPLANPTGLTSGAAVRVSGVIGDGPHGSSGGNTGDFDFFAVTGLVPGQSLVVDLDTPEPFGDLDPFVALWHVPTGFLIAFNDDDGSTFDSFLAVQVPLAGDYYVSIGGFGSFITADPFDSSSGLGPGSEGEYEATIGLDTLAFDSYTVDLDAGDTVGVTADGSAFSVTLFDPAGDVLVGSAQDLGFIYPRSSLLPSGGNASAAQVVKKGGRYGITVVTAGDYTADVRVFRPGLSEVPNQEQQILFIDFDGAVVDTSIYGLPPSIPQPRTLSPLSAFLAGWGLGPEDEDAVIDAILAAAEENLSSDMRTLGLNGDRDATGNPTEFDVAILNSRDHPDPFGQPNVSRVIVGGTIAESAIPTIGIAQSIDIGNFERSETALVLLDILSDPAPVSPSLFFLNNITIDPGSTIIDLIGIAVGNIVAHEAGHFLSSFHTDQFDAFANIMDQGGNPAGTFGLGPDLIFGTADDEDVDFGLDVYVPGEGFVGVEDTLNATAFGLATGRRTSGN